MFRIYHSSLSVHRSLVVTCWERADLLALLYVMFYCVFATFLFGGLGQVWCLIVLILDLYLLSYFNRTVSIEWFFSVFKVNVSLMDQKIMTISCSILFIPT